MKQEVQACQRLIKAQNRQNGEVLTFLTNIYEMSAEEVCARSFLQIYQAGAQHEAFSWT